MEVALICSQPDRFLLGNRSKSSEFFISRCSSSSRGPIARKNCRIGRTRCGMASAMAGASANPSVSDVITKSRVSDELMPQIMSEALVWSSLHGLVVGDRNSQRSGTVPGVGMVHAPFALLPVSFPKDLWKQACELAPLFNDLVDRVSLDGKFLQESLSRTRGVDSFTSRLLEIHAKMMDLKKTEDVRLGLHRSDYMLDAETKKLYQIELNTISASFPGLGSLVSNLHRNLLNQYGENLGLDTKNIPENASLSRFAEALAKAWNEYNDSSGGRTVGVVYFRAGYSPDDYPTESEWRARLTMEQSSAIKCPSISYHLVGTKKIQQELAKPNVLERFLDNKDDMKKLRHCFAGLWSLDDSEILKQATEKPELFVLKPQREGGGNNIYGEDVRETLFKLQKEGNKGLDAFILMQRIFPASTPTHLVRDGVCRRDYTISELGIYGAYLRNKDRIIINEQSGYLMRTKASSSNEGGVAAGYAVLDSIYLS
ncbi:glutathione synthetase, chloroplastic-like isoform X2 [Wolffia australiana]